MMCCWLISQAKSLYGQKRLEHWCDIYAVTMHSHFREPAYPLMEAGLHDSLSSWNVNKVFISVFCYNNPAMNPVLLNLPTVCVVGQYLSTSDSERLGCPCDLPVGKHT